MGALNKIFNEPPEQRIKSIINHWNSMEVPNNLPGVKFIVKMNLLHRLEAISSIKSILNRISDMEHLSEPNKEYCKMIMIRSIKKLHRV